MSDTKNLEQKCYIYLKEFPFDTDNTIHCANKRADISRATDEKTKAQKFYAYKLLERAICEQYGIEAKDLSFIKLPSGKWLNKHCNFSITHSLNVVCVAISNVDVGVDIEEYNPERFIKLKDKILTEDEKKLAPSGEELGEYLNQLWTKKEAVFKCQNLNYFNPSSLNVSQYFVKTQAINVGKKFYISIATKKRTEIILKK